MSNRSQKAAALRALKEARNRGISRTEDYEIKDEGDIYDVIEEDDYRNLVEKRRQREDFIVDDDGLGYHDDGEEHVFDQEEDASKKGAKVRTGAHATLSANSIALKKARKANELMESASSKHAKGSMWDFVKRGASAATLHENNAAAETKSQRIGMSASTLDSLLAGLDYPTHSSSSRMSSNDRVVSLDSRRESFGANPTFRSKTAERFTPHKRVMSNDGMPFSSEYSPPSAKANHRHDEGDDEHFVDHQFDTYDDVSHTKEPSDHVNNSFEDNFYSTSISSTKNQETVTESTATPRAPPETGASTLDNAAEKAGVTSKRVGFAKRSKLGQLSAPAQAAFQQQQNPSTCTPNLSISVDLLANHQQANSKIMSMVALGPQPDTIVGDHTSTGAHVDANLEGLLQRDGCDKSYIDFYYLDAFEKSGIVSLFGKIQLTPDDFVSACVIVHNNVRNLFVLPRPGSSMVDVHSEITSVLKPSCIPTTTGATFAAKPVYRKYAFDDPTVPREETQYLKVKYDAKYGVPPEEVCKEGGQHFLKIFNAGAPPLETFIIKRKLMGPSWIRIYNPKSSSNYSWCKLEMQVSSPKDIVPLRLVKEEQSNNLNVPTPPVKVVSIKLKTAINPAKNVSEVVSVSAICHHRVMLDTSSDMNCSKHILSLSMVRPLGQTIADQSGGLPQFPHNLDQEIETSMPQLQQMPNERAMLNRLFTQIGLWDPDVIVGHNAWGFDMDILLSRCVSLKVPSWSKVGRRKVTALPANSHFGRGKDWAIAEAMVGRVLCDTYLSAKELLRETTYSLKSLAETQLKTSREEIDPVDLPQFFNSSKTIVQLARHTLLDSQLVLKLMLKLQILPLTKQLTCIAGNLWARTMKGNRAERNEYLLLHEFHNMRYIVPEKKRSNSGKRDGRAAAKYSGGLVLEPKKGLYDSFILLLDFNSLYPSIIQEYNLCFTTIDWSSYISKDSDSTLKRGLKGPEVGDDDDEENEGNVVVSFEYLPPVPDSCEERGVLPRVIKTLVERRGVVKKMLKNERDADKKEELDIRQKALKLTANAMYGCLGFSHSRFYAQPIAAMVTAFGRDTLMNAVRVAEDTVGLDVIYGDTDSIMINTRLNNIDDFAKVLELGSKVKREVNKKYKTLELEVDGVFKSLLLLKKKKYAAVTVTRDPNGNFMYEKEMKGLDLVRRDWCIQSKESGRFVLDQILSGQEVEVVVHNIHQHMEELAKKMRNDELPLDKYVITKGLSKHPNDYPDGKTQPHVQVAKSMLLHNKPVNIGDHIPYVITLSQDPEASAATAHHPKKLSPIERARHPEEVLRSAGALKPDVEWYLMQQILPPIYRLCEPIAGTSQSAIAEKLGLDSTKYCHERTNIYEEDELVDYTPATNLSDDERFKSVDRFFLKCEACGERSEFLGALRIDEGKAVGSGLRCAHSDCNAPALWGSPSHYDCFARISNAVSLSVQKYLRKYYQGVLICDETTCSLETTQQSVLGDKCPARGCMGRLKPKYTEAALYTQLKYYDSMFDVDHACNQLERSHMLLGSRKDMKNNIPDSDQEILSRLRATTRCQLELSAYNFVEPHVWASLFGKGCSKTQLQ